MNLTDIKIYGVNTGAFMASCSDFIEPTLKILLLAATLGYTLNRWYVLRKKNKDE